MIHPSNLNVLVVNNTISIYEQLKIEEALLRASDENWCILNMGSLEPTIVMGISAKAEEMVNLNAVQSSPRQIPLLRRFSGGGTVVVDEKTLFFTLILSKSHIPSTSHGPKEYLQWVFHTIAPAFKPYSLTLAENDFALYDKKIGGNAQCFTKDRLLHHTSFLWEWDQEKMKLLRHPSKIPAYRRDRKHHDFCGKLQEYFPQPSIIMKGILECLSARFTLHYKDLDADCILEPLSRPHRKALEILNIDLELSSEEGFHYIPHTKRAILA